MIWTNLNLIKFCVLFCVCAPVFVLCINVQLSPFKSLAVKGGSSKRKELMIDVDDLSPRSKRTRFFNGSVWRWLVQILCCISDLYKLFSRCSIVGWKGRWSAISPRHQYSHMVCYQGLKLSSLKSWGCIRKLSERILCQCHCWRRGNQVLGERKAVLSYTHLLGWYSTHQQANITYATGIWWTESGWGGSSGSFRR